MIQDTRTKDPPRRKRDRERERDVKERRRVLGVHGFPTVNKAINFISPGLEKKKKELIPDRYTRGIPVNDNSTCCLIRRTSTTSANYGLLGRHGDSGPHGRVAFYLWLSARAHACTQVWVHALIWVIAFAELACCLFEGFHF